MQMHHSANSASRTMNDTRKPKVILRSLPPRYSPVIRAGQNLGINGNGSAKPLGSPGCEYYRIGKVNSCLKSAPLSPTTNFNRPKIVQIPTCHTSTVPLTVSSTNLFPSLLNSRAMSKSLQNLQAIQNKNNAMLQKPNQKTTSYDVKNYVDVLTRRTTLTNDLNMPRCRRPMTNCANSVQKYDNQYFLRKAHYSSRYRDKCTRVWDQCDSQPPPSVKSPDSVGSRQGRGPLTYSNSNHFPSEICNQSYGSIPHAHDLNESLSPIKRTHQLVDTSIQDTEITNNCSVQPFVPPSPIILARSRSLSLGNMRNYKDSRMSSSSIGGGWWCRMNSFIGGSTNLCDEERQLPVHNNSPQGALNSDSTARLVYHNNSNTTQNTNSVWIKSHNFHSNPHSMKSNSTNPCSRPVSGDDGSICTTSSSLLVPSSPQNSIRTPDCPLGASEHSTYHPTTTVPQKTSRIYSTPRLSCMLDTKLGSGVGTVSTCNVPPRPPTSQPTQLSSEVGGIVSPEQSNTPVVQLVSPPLQGALDLSDSGYSTSSCTSSQQDHYVSRLTVQNLGENQKNLVIDVDADADADIVNDNEPMRNGDKSEVKKSQITPAGYSGTDIGLTELSGNIQGLIVNINPKYESVSPSESLIPAFNRSKFKSKSFHIQNNDYCSSPPSPCPEDSSVSDNVNGAWLSDCINSNSLDRISHLRKSGRKNKAFLLTRLFGQTTGDTNKLDNNNAYEIGETRTSKKEKNYRKTAVSKGKYPQVPLPSNGISWAGKLANKLTDKDKQNPNSRPRLHRSNTVSSLGEEGKKGDSGEELDLESILLPSALPPQLRSRLSPPNMRRAGHRVNDEGTTYNGDMSNSVRPVALREEPEPVRSVHTVSYSHGHAVAECVNPLLARHMRGPANNNIHYDKLNLPERLMRPNRNNLVRKGSMKRSKSQPMHCLENTTTASTTEIMLRDRSKEEGETDSAGSHSPAPPDSSSTCRTSTYSTGSSVTSTSSASNDTHASWESSTDGIVSEALWDHVTMQPDELQFSVGDIINVCDWTHPNVWFGTCQDRCGWFPASHVRLLANQALVENEPIGDVEYVGANEDIAKRQTVLRNAVVQEMIATERDYFQLLKNLVEGFLYEARQRVELFPPEKILTIFGNIEEIYNLHTGLLADLEEAVNENDHASCLVGPCFIKYCEQFEVYSNYCNNHPLSCNELANLYRQPRYRQFFECCRLLRGMPDLTLDAFLLTPVQRICKYPLQLAELVKSTQRSHSDAQACSQALHAMRRVASVINERKRRLEHLQKIASWQKQVEGWQGPELLESSSMLVHSGEVTGRCMGTDGNSMWSKELVAFLFDRTLVLCRKDILKRNNLIFKDRICLDEATVSTLSDSKDSFFGSGNRYSWKVNVPKQDKVFLFTVRNRKSKEEWLSSFRQERETAQHTARNPPSSEEKRIALFALRPAPTTVSSVRLTRKLPPSIHLNLDLPNSKSVPSKMWNRMGKPTKA